MKIIKKLRNLLIISCVFCVTLTATTQAYVFNNNGLLANMRGRLRFYVFNAASGYRIETYAKKWNGYNGINLSSMSTLDPSTTNLTFDAYNQSTGNYAVTYHDSPTFQRIILYRSFNSLPSTQQYETIVHEVGHAVGLAHTQAQNNSISVMREVGFNNKAYPLSDDINGINALY